MEYKFQDQENSKDIFSFGSTLKDFICAVIILDRNIVTSDIVRIKRLLDDLRVIAAKLMLLVQKLLLLVLKVNATGLFLERDDQTHTYEWLQYKVPMLKPGEYGVWRMRMEQYIQMIDYSLWEVIENGNAPLIKKVVEGVETIIAPSTAKEKAQRRLELKARSTLLMGI
ncbi:hypothetical protein Tco_1311477, partial [Tanacetum coccineum]